MYRTSLALAISALLIIPFSQLRADDYPNAMISGSASFGGSATASGPSGVGSTTITFSSNWMFLIGTGVTYSGIPASPATFAPSFSFTGDGTSAHLTNPALPLWSFTPDMGVHNYSINLTSLSNGHVENGAMSFTGMGTLFATGFDPTVGSFAMSGTGNNFFFQLSFVTNSAIPEPSSIALAGFGLALCGAVTYFRRRRS
jgi:hypothetical protein